MTAQTQHEPLPTVQIILDAFRFVGGDWRTFLQMAALPVVTLSLLSVLVDTFNPAIEPSAIVDPETGVLNLENFTIPTGTLFLSIVNFLFYVMFAVAWHRKWLVGDEPISVWSALKWDNRKSQFLGQLVKLTLLCFLTILPVSMLLALIAQNTFAFPLTMLVAVATVGLLFARLCLVLPATAVDEPIALKTVFNAVAGNTWRMLIISILPQLPVSLFLSFVLILLSNLLYTANLYDTLSGQLAVTLVAETVSYFGIAVGVTALSISYRILFPGSGASSGSGSSSGTGSGPASTITNS